MIMDMSLYISIMIALLGSLFIVAIGFLRIRKLERDVYRYQMRIRNLTKA